MRKKIEESAVGARARKKQHVASRGARVFDLPTRYARPLNQETLLERRKVAPQKKAILAGAHFEMVQLAKSLNFDLVAVCDPAKTGPWHDFLVYGQDEEAIVSHPCDGVILAIDDSQLRAKVQTYYAGLGVEALNVLGGTIDSSSSYGPGLVACQMSIVTTECTLGQGVRLNVGATVMHDCSVGDFTTLAPHALLLGHVTVEEECYIGAKATILPGLRVGRGSVVGAGAVVTKDVPPGRIVKGVPAR